MYTNRVNGKVYIGRTCQTLERRAGTQGNNYKSCHKFWNAIQKYGWDNFVPSILLDNLTFKEAALKEIEFINPGVKGQQVKILLPIKCEKNWIIRRKK